MSEKICERCERPILYPFTTKWTGKVVDAQSVIIRHDGYGCDTGCCGHRIYIVDCQGHEEELDFEFGHPDGVDDVVRYGIALGLMHAPGVPVDFVKSDISGECKW